MSSDVLRANEPEKFVQKIGRVFARFQSLSHMCPRPLDGLRPFLIYWVIVIKIRFTADVIVNAERAGVAGRSIVYNEFAASLSVQVFAREAALVRSWNEMAAGHYIGLPVKNLSSKRLIADPPYGGAYGIRHLLSYSANFHPKTAAGIV